MTVKRIAFARCQANKSLSVKSGASSFLCEIYDLCLHCHIATFFFGCIACQTNNKKRIGPPKHSPEASSFLVSSVSCCMPAVNDPMHPASPCSKMMEPHARKL